MTTTLRAILIGTDAEHHMAVTTTCQRACEAMAKVNDVLICDAKHVCRQDQHSSSGLLSEEDAVCCPIYAMVGMASLHTLVFLLEDKDAIPYKSMHNKPLSLTSRQNMHTWPGLGHCSRTLPP